VSERVRGSSWSYFAALTFTLAVCVADFFAFFLGFAVDFFAAWVVFDVDLWVSDFLVSAP
jgi:hypothetical protein